MELKLYNSLKYRLLGDLVEAAEGVDGAYQQRVEAYAPKTDSGMPQPMGRRIRYWLELYNRLANKTFRLRYYQILALYFTEHVLTQKRQRKEFLDQKALVYWMATGSGKTLLMHINIVQYIEHIGGFNAFDELQIVLTTPGINLIEQHQRELEPFVAALNRTCNQRIKLIIASTQALLNKETGYFRLPDNPRVHRLVLVDEGHIGLAASGQALGSFKKLRQDLISPTNSFLFEYSATYLGIAEKHVKEYEEQIVYDYNYYRFFKNGYGKDFSIQRISDDRFADSGREEYENFFTAVSTLAGKLQIYHDLRVAIEPDLSALPFQGQFSNRPLLAFMGNTVEDPKDEGKNDEVSDIRKILRFFTGLSLSDRKKLERVFNGSIEGRLNLIRSPGVLDEIWLTWGDGEPWGIINVGNGDKFFNDCKNHPELLDSKGRPLIDLRKAPIIAEHHHFSAIDEPSSPINILIGSRKFAEGWNCFRVSVIGLVNLGSTKGNKIIQIFGRGVRLKGLQSDGKRKFADHNEGYESLTIDNTGDSRLRQLETLNVFSLKKSYLEQFLKALEDDLPTFVSTYSIKAVPALVKIGRKRQLSFEDYRKRLKIFKIGREERDEPVRVIFNSNGKWGWEYLTSSCPVNGKLPAFSIVLDYRPDPEHSKIPIQGELRQWIADYPQFLPLSTLRAKIDRWCRESRFQLYISKEGELRKIDVVDLVSRLTEVHYHEPLEKRSLNSIVNILDQVIFDTLNKIRHKIQYDINKRQYRIDEPLSQVCEGGPGDFIDQYTLTYEFETAEAQTNFQKKVTADRQELTYGLKETTGPYHIYDPLFGEADDKWYKQRKIRKLHISPDALNVGERKFLHDILAHLDQPNYINSKKEYYLMRNVESLRSVGIYLEGETRVFFPDFVLWIVDQKKKKTQIVFFDPKGQTGIRNDTDMTLNDKVRIATSGQLTELARKLESKYPGRFDVQSFILLRDSSPLGKWKGQVPNREELILMKKMQKTHVFRLDWHQEDENGNRINRLIDGKNYLDLIFEGIDK